MAFNFHLSILLLCIHYSVCFTREEPRCSKFDFEEKVLEKMVRMEHSSGIMMDDFKELKAQVNNNLLDMKREFADIKRQVQEEQERYKSLIEDYLRGPSYSFSAYWLSNANPSVGETLIFNRVLLNENEAYNSQTGEYTVPVTGTYMFTATLCTGPDRWTDVQFVADGTVIGAFRSADQGWHTCHSSSVTAHLQKSMKVKMTIRRRVVGGVPFYNEDGHLQCSFAGHLIK